MSDAPFGSRTSAGKLHLLDLTGLKSRMAERWARMAETIERFFEGAIRRHLGPGDTFLRQGELSYILLFRDLTPQEAQVKCRTVCEELGERLFGDQIQDASLRTLVAPLAGDSFTGPAVCGAVDALLEHKGIETIIRVRPGTARQGAAAPDAVRPAGTDDDGAAASFQYRPIWDTMKKVVITYLCQSVDGGDIPSEAAEVRQAYLDRCILRECAARTQDLHRRGYRLLSGVTVALDTISYSRLWRHYSTELLKVSPDVSRDFAFFVTGIDSGVPNIRLTQELPKLGRLSRNLFCLLNDRGYVGARFARTGAHAIGIALCPGDAENISTARVTELSLQAAGAGIAAFVLGIGSTSIMLHALAQGIRYLEGPVIRPPVAQPRHAFAQSLEDICAPA